jgi:TRAP-type uncharacterized transport system substrate-binding protein
MNRQSDNSAERFGYFGTAALVTMAGFVLAYQFIEPAPPDHITMATGRPDGAYHRFAEQYRTILARDGITLELVPSAGSVENLTRLRDPGSDTDLALVQGGLAPADESALVSLGSLFYEPVWFFFEGDREFARFSELNASRVAIGEEGSGTRALALEILQANGISADAEGLLPLAGTAAADALLASGVDGVFLVGSPRSPVVQRLLESRAVQLMDVVRAEAYVRRTDYLSSLELPQGVISLEFNRPPSDVRLLATAASLIARPDLHPALVDLLLMAASEVHGQRGLFTVHRQFPSPDLTDFPLSDEARRFYTHGPPFLQTALPFWAANLVDRLKIMLLPFLFLLVPLSRLLPPIYRWRMRSRVYRWYGELAELEQNVGTHVSEDQMRQVELSLNRLEHELKNVQVPRSYANELYGLRLHLELVRKAVLHRTRDDEEL